MEVEEATRGEILIVMKHVCKFCNKRFPCGRSLGGHMRSHLITNPSDHGITDKEKVNKTIDKKKKKKNQVISPPPTNTITTTSTNDFSGEAVEAGYELRENPKKTWRAVGPAKDSTEQDPSLLPFQDSNNNQSKSCKQCGKAFHSSKALSGHMKSHAVEREKEKEKERQRERERAKENSLLGDHDSWVTASNNNSRSFNGQIAKQQVVDSHSDNEDAAPASTHKPRRSSRRPRYMEAAINSSSPSLADNNNNGATSSVSEIDQQEQEEVAMSLIMLSRDVGPWGGIGVTFTAELSDKNSAFLEAPPPKGPLLGVEEAEEDKGSSLLERVRSSSSVKNMKVEDLVADEFKASGCMKNFSKTKSSEGSADCVNRIERTGAELGRLVQAEFADPANSDLEISKRKMRTQVPESDKRSKFECTTCNKTFHSYQALGGHRASHKKSKGCSPSKLEGTEIRDSEETAEILGSVSHHNQLKGIIDGGSKRVVHMVQKHKCPICFKVFPSGQALGGHKRSHLMSTTAATQSPTENKIIGAEKSSATAVKATTSSTEARDFLDLNLPAPVEEEASNGGSHHHHHHHHHHLDLVGFKPWWVESTQKHEQLVSLISN